MGQFLDEQPTAGTGRFLDEPAAPMGGRELLAKGIVSSGLGTQPAGEAERLQAAESPASVPAALGMVGTGLASVGAQRVGLGPFPAALARVLGGVAGGEAGGQIAGMPTGEGALRGGVPAAVGEAAVGVGGKLLRSAPGAKGRIAGADAANLGTEIGRQSPPLAGAQTAGDLRSMAAGPGREALGAAKEQAIVQIESMLPAGTVSVPALGPAPMSLRDANQKLSEIGARAFSKNPLDRNVLGVDQRQLYGQVANEIEAALPATARPLWQTAQADYKKGLALMRPLQGSNAMRQYPDELQLNTPALQTYIANPRNEAALRNKLGDQGYEMLVNVLTRGGGVGTRDILAPGQGRALDAVRQSVGRGTNTGSLQMLGVPFRTLLPNAGSQYAGQAPYSLPPALQTILDIALQQRAGAPRSSE